MARWESEKASWRRRFKARFLANDPPPSRGEWVYFMWEMRAGGGVKIGYATDVEHRLRQHNVSNSADVVLLGWCGGGRPVEKAIHHALARDHIKGEWFQHSRQLVGLLHGLRGREDVTPEVVGSVAATADQWQPPSA